MSALSIVPGGMSGVCVKCPIDQIDQAKSLLREQGYVRINVEYRGPRKRNPYRTHKGDATSAVVYGKNPEEIAA